MSKLQNAPSLEYFGEGGITRPGAARNMWRESSDNPMSPTFVPLQDRGPQAQARWFAMQGRRKNDSPAAGVFG